MDNKRTLNDIKTDIISLVEEAEGLLGNPIEVKVWSSVASDNPYTSLPRLLSRDRHVRITVNG